MKSAPEFQGYCTQCHETRRIAVGAFCPVCATPLVDLHEVSVEDLPATVGGASIVTPWAATPLTTRQLPPQWGPPPPTNPVVTAPPLQPHRPRRALFATLLAVVLLIAGIVAVFLVGRGKSDKTELATQPPAASTPASARPTLPAATAPGVAQPAATTPLITQLPTTQPVVVPPPATGGNDGVVLVSSNAYVEQGGLSIDGEDRTLYIVAEIRNDNAGAVSVDEATVTIRDGSGNVIGTRKPRPIDNVLAAGETTYLYEFTPSMTYWEGETNNFPEGWASFEFTFNVQPWQTQHDWDDVNLSVEAVVVSPSGTATGVIRNTTADPVQVTTLKSYIALYDAKGSLANVEWTYVTAGGVDTLQPGETIPFEVSVAFGPHTYATTVVGAVAS
jgi:hypothetical protein